MKRRQWNKLFEIHTQIVCAYCLRPIESRSQITIDHEPPLSRQRELGRSKTVYACRKCNHQKGSLTADEYIEWKRLESIRNGVQR